MLTASRRPSPPPLSLSLPCCYTAAAGAYSSTYHPDWSILAARIAVSDLHKQTDASFSRNCAKLHGHIHPKTGAPAPLIADDVNDIVQVREAQGRVAAVVTEVQWPPTHRTVISPVTHRLRARTPPHPTPRPQANSAKFDAAINYTRDFDFDYFGFKTLERSYLLRDKHGVAERPQHMFMRVSVSRQRERGETEGGGGGGRERAAPPACGAATVADAASATLSTRPPTRLSPADRHPQAGH
jgi:hypothetical protein